MLLPLSSTPFPALLLPERLPTPPFKLILVLLIVSVPFAAVAVSPNAPLPVPQTFTPLKVRLWFAKRVKVALPALMMSPDTVILPPAVPPPAVVTVTFVLVFRALEID